MLLSELVLLPSPGGAQAFLASLEWLSGVSDVLVGASADLARVSPIFDMSP